MFRALARSFLAVAACTLVVAGCEPVTEPAPGEETANNTPLLKENCVDPNDNHCLPDSSDDPAAAADGYFLGSQLTMDQCKLGPDSDLDGLRDDCEHRIATAFAPLLRTNPFDGQLTRETYWAAAYRPPNWDGQGLNEHVEVMYLLGYHWDSSHFGDSEFIKHRINFNTDTQHWELFTSFLSAHYDTSPVGGSDSSEHADYDELTYPDGKYRGYPRVWVSKNKHGNYKNLSKCNSGSIFDYDTCNGNRDDVRVSVARFRNVGSRLRKKFVNGVGSAIPSAYPGTEFFWSPGVEFCGWAIVNRTPFTNCSGGYERVLTGFWF